MIQDGSNMEYDDLLLLIGEFGLYQKIVFVLVSLTAFQAAFSNMSIVFLGATPAHSCQIPDIKFLHFLNLSEDAIRNITLPMDGDYHSKCQMYQYAVNYSAWGISEVNLALSGDLNATVVNCQYGWVYDTSTYKSTIVTDYDLVCEKEPLVAVSQSCYMAGLMVGVLIFGNVSDIFGRRIGFAVTLFVSVVFMIATSFAQSFYAFVALRFMVGIAAIGLFTVAFVIVIEFVGPSWRVFTGISIEHFWAVGYMLVAGLAFAIREWNKLQLALSVPLLALFLVPIIVPESPRWLYANQKSERAEPIVNRIAKINKTDDKLPSKLEITVKVAPKAYVWDLFRYPKLRYRTIITYFIWFVNSLVYYGLSLNTSNLGGNDYINFLISAAVEIPAYIMCQSIMNRIGRKLPLIFSMVLGGVFLLFILAVPASSSTWAVVLSTAGKFCISASFAIIYVFSAEIFPTVVRNIGVGSGSFWARVGGIIAPQIARLSKYSRAIPMVVFGVLSIAAGLSSIFLPETNNRVLPQTIEDGENFTISSLDLKNKANKTNNLIDGVANKQKDGVENLSFDDATSTVV